MGGETGGMAIDVPVSGTMPLLPSWSTKLKAKPWVWATPWQPMQPPMLMALPENVMFGDVGEKNW